VLSMIRFLHVASAMALFAWLGMEGVVLRQLRSSADGGVMRAAAGQTRAVQLTGMVTTLLALLTGVYLATVEDQWQRRWVVGGLIGLVVVAAIDAAVSAPRVRRVVRAIATDAGAGGGSAAAAAGDPGLVVSYAARVAVLLWIVYLMTVHP
jgi:putative Mn2+ efflux pump MntP